MALPETRVCCHQEKSQVYDRFRSAKLKQDVKGVVELLQQSPFDEEGATEAMAAIYRTLTALKAQDSKGVDKNGALMIEETLNAFKADLRSTLNRSHALINRYGSVLEEREAFQGLQPSVENLREVMTLSHRLAYSSFAPYGFEMGDELRAFKPPAPQANHFRASKLHDFETQYQAMMKQQSGQQSSLSSEEEQQIRSPGKRLRSDVDDDVSSSALENRTVEGGPRIVRSSPAMDEKELSESELAQMEMDSARMTTENVPSAFLLNPDLEDVLESSSLDETSSQET